MLFVLIVNWNVRERLRACLQSLRAHPSTRLAQRVIVVDNASSDGSAAMVRAEFPEVHLIANTTNRGFTGGNNDGLRFIETLSLRGEAQPRYVLLLNPDTEVMPGALDALLDCAEAHPRVAVIGPQLRYPDGRIQSSRRRFPTLLTAIFESTPLQPHAPRAILERYYARDLPDDRTAEVDWVVGAAMLVRWEAIRSVGFLDEQHFFMYSEEVDWCRRFKQASWRVLYCPNAQIMHHEAQSSEQVVAQRLVHFNTSKVRYFAKHHGRAQAELLRLILLALWARELGFEALKWLLGHKRPLRAGRVRAYAHALRSGFL